MTDVFIYFQYFAWTTWNSKGGKHKVRNQTDIWSEHQATTLFKRKHRTGKNWKWQITADRNTIFPNQFYEEKQGKKALSSTAQICFKGRKIKQQVTRLNCENVSKEMAEIEIHKHAGSCRRAHSDHRCSQARTATTLAAMCLQQQPPRRLGNGWWRRFSCKWVRWQ